MANPTHPLGTYFIVVYIYAVDIERAGDLEFGLGRVPSGTHSEVQVVGVMPFDGYTGHADVAVERVVDELFATFGGVTCFKPLD